MKSILRYPGGKSRAVNTILSLIPQETKELCSPFFGGGSIEFACAINGIQVYGYDVFEPLAVFWQQVFQEPEKIADIVRKYHPLPKEKFIDLQKQLLNITDEQELAAAFYVLNRASFSGATLSGGSSPNHPRFNKASIQRLADFKAQNISVECLSFEQSIIKHPDAFLYLDPPYLINSYLYGNKGDTHKGFEHEKLRDILKTRKNWILSYNNCPEILEWYKDYEIIYPSWSYGLGNSKESKEVLILNFKKNI